MRLNEECIRDTLQYLVDNLELNLTDLKGDFNSLSLLSVMKHFDNIYSKEDIWYSIYNLSKDNFIETNDIRKNSVNAFAYVYIFNVTHRGHNFYESIQPEPIWNKTKNVVSKVGVHTLEFMESVAHDIILESAKQIILSTQH